MRWITRSPGFTLGALALLGGVLSACASSHGTRLFAGEAAGIVALAGRNPNQVYGTVLHASPMQSGTRAARRSRDAASDHAEQ